MKVLAHRGLNREALENTIEAFQLAVERSIEGVELDVQLAKCGTPVVFHDEDLGRLFGRLGQVGDYTADELRRIHPPSQWAYPDAFIPTLAEVLALFPVGFFVNIELKAPRIFSHSPARAVASLIEDFPHLDLLISSFNPVELTRFHARSPETPYGLLFGPASAAPLRHAWSGPLLAKAKMRSVHPSWKLVSQDLVERNHERGLLIALWTVNDPAIAVWLHELGVDVLISDTPGAILAAIG